MQSKAFYYFIITLIHASIAVLMIGGLLPIVLRAVEGRTVFMAMGIYLLLGVFFPVSYMFKYHESHSGPTWKITTLCPLALTLLVSALVIFFPESRGALESSLSQAVYDHFEIVQSQLDGMSMGASVSTFLEYRDEIIHSFLIYSPAILYTTLALIFYFTERVFYRLTPREITPMPDAFLALLIVSGLCLILPFGLKTFGLNLLLCVGMLYFLRGIDILRYFLTSWRMHPVVRGILYFLILITQPFIIGVALLGFISVYKNFIKGEDTSDGNRV